MSRLTFVNLPVRELARTKEFFTALGFAFNDQFSDDNTLCMVISEQAYAMLHVKPTFETYADSAVADASEQREVFIGLSADGREDVDDVIAKAAAAGGTVGELVDNGPMYMQPFHDLDGHRWSVIYMDMSAVPS